MKTLNKILSNKEIEKLVAEGKAKYISWGQRRNEIVYIKNKIYWHHTESHYHYLGERK